MDQKTLSRREVLSSFSKVDEPPGLLAPTTLKYKSLLQKLIKAGRAWIEPLQEPLATEAATNQPEPGEAAEDSDVKPDPAQLLELLGQDAENRGYTGGCDRGHFMFKIEVHILADRELVMEQTRSMSKEINKPRREMKNMTEDSRVGEEVKVEVQIDDTEAGAMLEEMVLMEDVTYPRRWFIYNIGHVFRINNFDF